MESLDTFTPTMPVSVIIPYYQTPAETLERTLAALEGQTYPRELFEVIIADDGSEPPLERLPATPLDVKVVRQERRGFGAARARNNGARAAAHDILLFLDSDMLAERDWMAAHACWHHAVSDALTIGSCPHVQADGISAETICRWPGPLKELLSEKAGEPSWTESHMVRTNNLTSRADDLFRVTLSGNLGIRRDFYWSAGGFNESFTRYGMEDIEFGYRAYTHGGLLVPVQDPPAWHQGLRKEIRETTDKDRDNQLQRQKAAHFIAHPMFRSNRPGRIFQVPQYVVTIKAGYHPAEPIIKTTANILADREHDLEVRVEASASSDAELMERLRDEFGADPRVHIAPSRSALDEFPASPFQVTLPAAVFARDLVHRLRAGLGSAATATSTLPDGSAVSITRAWALHRARRAGGCPADFGEARTIPAKTLKPRRAGPVDYPSKWDTLLGWMQDIRSPADAWSFLRSLAVTLRRRCAALRR